MKESRRWTAAPAANSQHPDDLLTIREPFLESRVQHEKVIVHGHTIVPRPERLPNRIAVDTGAYASGLLTAVVLRDTQAHFLHNASGY